MLLQEEGVQTLVNLGLTVLQAKVYIALAKLGTSTGRTTAKEAEVASQDVYRVLSELQEKCLVEKIISKPSKYRPIPLEEGLSMLLQRRNKQTAELKKAVFEIFKSFQSIDKREDKNETGDFVLIPEKETLIRERVRAMDNAKEKILIMIPLKKLESVLTNTFESFSKAIERKVSLQIITEKTENEIELKKLSEGLDKSACFEVRTVPPPLPANFGIYDRKEIRLSTSSKSGYAGAPDIWSNNSDIIELAQDYFKIKWMTATPTKTQKKPEKGKKRI